MGIAPDSLSLVVEIQWTRLSGKTFEDMVACLLSHQNPDIRRIDGSGGDGGRDCQFDALDGLHAYEMKGFPGGRMGKAQRRQVARSLATARLLNPVEWVLIVPIDHTEGEKAWFEKLGDGLPFPIHWRGKMWLDLEFAQRPFIANYYLGDTRSEVIDILRELQKEQGALTNGIPDAMSRIAALVTRANELDPHYRFKITSDGRTTSVTIIPAYVGAEIDRPITVKAEFRIPTTTAEGRAKAEEFQRALDFGTPVELSGDLVPYVIIDAPAGLGGTLEGPPVSWGRGKPVSDECLDLVFTVCSPDGAPRADLTIRHTPESSGLRGTVLHGRDRAGYIETELVIDVVGGQYKIKFRTSWQTFIPHDFAPIARFLAEYHSPNTVYVATDDGKMRSEVMDCGREVHVPSWVAEFVTNLAMIQAAAGIVREISEDITSNDASNADGAVALLRGKEIPIPWTSATVGLRSSASLETRSQIAKNTIRFETTIDAPVTLDICGTTYPVGRRYRSRGVARVDPGSLETLLAHSLTTDIDVELVPDPNEPSALIRLLD
jgi:hypothetical protein